MNGHRLKWRNTTMRGVWVATWLDYTLSAGDLDKEFHWSMNLPGKVGASGMQPTLDAAKRRAEEAVLQHVNQVAAAAARELGEE